MNTRAWHVAAEAAMRKTSSAKGPSEVVKSVDSVKLTERECLDDERVSSSVDDSSLVRTARDLR